MPDPAERFAVDLRALFVSARHLLTDDAYEQVALPALTALSLLLPDGVEVEVPTQRLDTGTSSVKHDPLDTPMGRVYPSTHYIRSE